MEGIAILAHLGLRHNDNAQPQNQTKPIRFLTLWNQLKETKNKIYKLRGIHNGRGDIVSEFPLGLVQVSLSFNSRLR